MRLIVHNRKQHLARLEITGEEILTLVNDALKSKVLISEEDDWVLPPMTDVKVEMKRPGTVTTEGIAVSKAKGVIVLSGMITTEVPKASIIFINEPGDPNDE